MTGPGSMSRDARQYRLTPGLYQVSSTPPVSLTTTQLTLGAGGIAQAVLAPRAVLVIMYSLAGKASPSWSAQPTRKLSPGPCVMLVGMQFSMGKLPITAGPTTPPPSGALGLMMSTFPTKRAPVEFEFVSRKYPVVGSQVCAPSPAGEIAGTQFACGCGVGLHSA